MSSLLLTFRNPSATIRSRRRVPGIVCAGRFYAQSRDNRYREGAPGHSLAPRTETVTHGVYVVFKLSTGNTHAQKLVMGLKIGRAHV